MEDKRVFVLGAAILVILVLIFVSNIDTSELFEEKSIFRTKKQEEQKKRDSIEKSICKYLGFSEYSNNVFVDFNPISGVKTINIYYSMYEINSIFSACCEESVAAVRNLIESNLIEWNFEKDELSITLFKIFEAKRKDRGEKDDKKPFFIWETHDLEKGKFVDFEKSYIADKTVEELKKYNFNE